MARCVSAKAVLRCATRSETCPPRQEEDPAQSRGVSYIDSSGIGELIANYTTVSRQGGQLKLLNLTDRIQNLLVITKLLTVFDAYDNEAEALKSF
jgi:ABC-type transporter Mla MlaB component